MGGGSATRRIIQNRGDTTGQSADEKMRRKQPHGRRLNNAGGFKSLWRRCNCGKGAGGQKLGASISECLEQCRRRLSTPRLKQQEYVRGVWEAWEPGPLWECLALGRENKETTARMIAAHNDC